jgi:hypothetical protein
MAFVAKPGVPRAVHLFAAPFLWTAIGCLLMVRGWGWLDPRQGKVLFLAAGLLGTLKSLFILDKIALQSLDRIIRFRGNICLGAVYSWKTWLLVLLMMVAGLAVRSLIQPGPGIGIFYSAVGWSLCLSSRMGWREWFRRVRHHEFA